MDSNGSSPGTGSDSMLGASVDARIPITLLTGFLGSGKTTLINRILTERSRERIAVLVNEFGDVSVDGRLVIRSEEEVVELANGCVCCSVRGDLVRALGKVLRPRVLGRARPLDRILVETSGLASPGPVLQTLLVEPELHSRTRSAGVVTLAHGALIVEQLASHPEAGDQVGYADLLVLNHVDRCDPGALAEARRALTALNPGARQIEATRAAIRVGQLFEGMPAENLAGSLSAARLERVDSAATHEHAHGAGAISLRSHEPLRLEALKMWLQFLTSRRSHELWRIKGVLRCVGRPKSVVVQSVYQFLELGAGEEDPPEESVLVVIGRNLDRAELERGWAASH